VLETKDKSISQSVDELESYVYRGFGIDMVSDFAGEGI
jgi:hypothetical protein